ncbi:MAG: hypothetical protein SPG48_11320 [Treponema sp.]|nr:hypothetical protein [Treponema sp.]
MKKIITCTGYGNSGSSAATDFLREFSNVNSIGSNFEFTFLHENDGIADLEYNFTEGHRLKTDLAVKRFIKFIKSIKHQYNPYFNNKFYDLTIEYLNNLNLCEWKGWWHRAFEVDDDFYRKRKFYDYAKFSYNIKNHKNKYNLYEPDKWRPSYTPFSKQYYRSLWNEEEKADFIFQTKSYLNSLFSNCSDQNNSDFLLFDQLLPPINPAKYEKYFDYIKTIVVDKDPRDIYFSNKIFWGNRFFPTDNVDVFIEWFKQTRNSKNNTKNILYIKLEDMIYNYESSAEKIINFIGLNPSEHCYKRKFFDPAKSISNTRLWEKFDIVDKVYDLNLREDLVKIERELKDFCFDYSNINFPEKKAKVDFVIEKALSKADIVIENEKLNLFQFSISLMFSIIRGCYCILRQIYHWIKK